MGESQSRNLSLWKASYLLLMYAGRESTGHKFPLQKGEIVVNKGITGAKQDGASVG